MIFYKILKYDIRNGIIKEYKKYIAIIIIFFASCMDFNNKTNSSDSSISFVDYIFHNIAGMSKYEYSKDNPFRFPILWMLIMLILLYIILSYPYNDLLGYGKSILINSKSRAKWWLSKCIWVILSILLFFGLMYGVTIIFCIINGNAISLKISKTAYQVIVLPEVDSLFNTTNVYNLPDFLNMQIFVLPILTCISIGLIQLLLSLWIKPLYSYIAMITLLVVSAYHMNIFLIGSYAMVQRSNYIISDGMPLNFGIILTLLISIATILIGLISFKHYDIIGKE